MTNSLTKPAWWSELAATYGFSNDSTTSISQDDFLHTLRSIVAVNPGLLTSANFTGVQSSVVQDSANANDSDLLISETPNNSLFLGYGGADYLSGGTGSDVFVGGTDSDVIQSGGGTNFIVGSGSGSPAAEQDTVTYLTAPGGIVVDADPSSGQYIPVVHTVSWSDWTSDTVEKISGFKTGAGGDIVDFSALLANVGYHGTNPVADGYIKISDISSGMKIQFDPDGSHGKASAVGIVTLTGVHAADFSVANNLSTTPGAAPPTQDQPGVTFVSNNGSGSYDVLYSIENIIGSDHNDVIHGRNDVPVILAGGDGDDIIYAGSQNDILIGGMGNDTLYGGAGKDVFLIDAGSDQLYSGTGQDTFKFDGSFKDDLGLNSATVFDFKAGSGGDQVDVGELLAAVGYAGSNAIGDGYVVLGQDASGNTTISIDPDGTAGPASASLIATLSGVQAGSFSTASNLLTQSPDILYATTAGQSNAEGLADKAPDGSSGILHLTNGLVSEAGFAQVYTLPQDLSQRYITLAVGGATVDGDTHPQDLSRIWWYPNEGTPGDDLTRAVALMIPQVAALRAQGDVTPIVIWGQGEAEAKTIGSFTNPADQEAAAQRYVVSTLAVFQYIQDHVGHDIQFYLMETGNFSVAGAQAEGLAQKTINATELGLQYIHAAQEQMALANPDIHLAVNYSDLPMMGDPASQSDPSYQPNWATDDWHMTYAAREVMGDRLADFISLNLGKVHVISNTGPYPADVLSDIDIHAGSGLTIHGDANNDIITGTTGSDTIYAGTGNDAIIGGGGGDTLIGGSGTDTFVFQAASAFNNVDEIGNFAVSQGDKIDIRSLLTDYDPLTNALSDFVKIDTSGNNSILSVDKDGPGHAFGWTQVAVLDNVTGLDVHTLVNNGNLIVH